MSPEISGASALSQFQFKASKQIRVVMMDDQPWFVAADICAVLEHTNPTMALRRLDDDERKLLKNNSLNSSEGLINQTLNENQDIAVVNESGLYSLIFTSRKAEAKQFKKWVTSQVLPAIRKTGRYEHPDPLTLHKSSILDRIAMYLQARESVFDLVWARGPQGVVTYGDVYHQWVFDPQVHDLSRRR